MSIKKNILKNGIATVIAKSFRILEQLLLVPFFIASWGPGYYGEWLTLTIIPSMMAFSDLGFGTSAANRFLLQYAAGDRQGAANTSRSGVFLISLVVAGGIILSAVLIFILQKLSVFDKSLIPAKDAVWALFFMMSARVITFYNQFYEAYFRAARRASLGINLQTIYSASNIVFGLLVLVSGGGIVAFALVNLIVSVIFNPAYNWKARNVLGLYKTHRGVVLRSEIKGIMKNGFGYLLSPVWQAIYFQGTTFVVRLTLGPVAVTIFNTVRTLIRSVSQVFNMITLAVFPEFQFEVGAGNFGKARKVFRVTFLGIVLCALAGILFLYFLGPWFYQLWTKKSLDPPPAMWNIFILSIAFNATWWMATIIFQAYNKPYYFTLAGTLAASISVAVTWALSGSYGLSGAAFGSFILDFLLALYLLPAGCRMLGQPLTGLFSDIRKLKLRHEN